jgi:uncharacterized protein
MVLTAEQTARCFYDSLEPGRRQDLMMILDPHVVLEIPEGLPGSRGTYTGLKVYLEDFLYYLYGTFDVTFVPEEFFQSGETVVVLGRFKGRTMATGVEFDVPFCHIWTVQDGRLVRGRMFTDTAILAHAISGPPTASARKTS